MHIRQWIFHDPITYTLVLLLIVLKISEQEEDCGGDGTAIPEYIFSRLQLERWGDTRSTIEEQRRTSAFAFPCQWMHFIYLCILIQIFTGYGINR